MKIWALNLVNKSSMAPNVINKNQDFKTYNSLMTSTNLQNDVFIKSKKVSFKASENSTNNDKLIVVPTGTAAFLVPLVYSIAMAKSQNPDDIFTQNGYYLGQADSLFLNTEKAKKLGIDLDPKRFEKPDCFCDDLNGNYRDFIKGIDINLKEGKYIDPENGIYVNSEKQISVIYMSGEIIPITVPNFGSGYSTRVEKQRWENRDIETIYLEDQKEEKTQEEYSPMSFVERVKNFFNSDNKDVTEDIMGREMYSLRDEFGRIHKVALSDKLEDKFYQKYMSYEDANEDLAKEAIESIKEHIINNCTVDISNWTIKDSSIENFIENVIHENTDNDDISDTDDYSRTYTQDDYYSNYDNYSNDYNDDIFDLI